MPPTLDPPFPGSKALLRIGTTWVTSKAHQHILQACWSPSIITYCRDKYNWSDTTFQSISWRSIRAARRKCTPTQMVKMSKIMHDWLPVMHMQAHITGVRQCPNCTHNDETLDHLFHCTHPTMKCKREELLAHLRKKGLKLGIPYPILDAMISLFSTYFNNGQPTHHTYPDLIQRAATTQLNIGLMYLPRGYLATSWIDAMEAYDCPHPAQKLAALIYFIWNDITDTLWRTRNELVHHTHNLTDLATEDDLAARLTWYLGNYRDVLAPSDHHLVRFNTQDIQTWSLPIRKEWLQHLMAADAAFTLERNLRPPGQPLITDYFTRPSGP